jgi:hypothetical protein
VALATAVFGTVAARVCSEFMVAAERRTSIARGWSVGAAQLMIFSGYEWPMAGM